MTNIKLTVTGAQARASVTGPLTSGMVGLPVAIEYDEAWDALTKNLICRCSPWGSNDGEYRAILNVGETAAVAHEVMQPDMYLYLGLEGFREDGTLVMPTTWACCGKIAHGANTCEDLSTAPSLSVWNQLQVELEQLQEQADEVQACAQEARQAAEEAKEAAASAGGGLYYTPIVTQPTDSTLEFQFQPSVSGAAIPNPVVVELPGGENADTYAFLTGLKYYALGDSIVDMQGTLTAPETFGDTGYTTDLQGRDISGITVEGYVTAIERRYGLIATNFGKGGHTLVGDFSTLATMDYSDVALVTIAYGVNDARSGVPLGTVNSTDTTTFAGALNQLLRKIYTDNPECRVLVLSPMQRLTVTDFGIATPNANGNYLIDFVNMCKAIAEKRSTAFLDQYRSTGINQTNLCYYTVEGVHPVNQGFARIRNAVIGILDELFELEYEPFGSMTGTGGEEPEEPDTGGDSGGEAPPAEDTEGGSMELTADDFVFDAVIYDGYMPTPNRVGEAAYNASSIYVCTDATELPAGAVYTLTTYLANDGVYAGYIHTTAERQVWDEAQGKYVPNGNGTVWKTNMCTVEEVTIDGAVRKKLTYAVDCTKATKYVWFGILRGLEDKASITYV